MGWYFVDRGVSDIGSDCNTGGDCILLSLSFLRLRLGVSEFCACVDPWNTVSQCLMEKLGAVPNGISEIIVHGEKEKAI